MTTKDAAGEDERAAMLAADEHVKEIISHGEAEQILIRFNTSHWRNKKPGDEPARYSIPANPQRDDDLRLHAYIQQQRAREQWQARARPTGEQPVSEPLPPDQMCPNCVTPWKCNGPHEPAGSGEQPARGEAGPFGFSGRGLKNFQQYLSQHGYDYGREAAENALVGYEIGLSDCAPPQPGVEGLLARADEFLNNPIPEESDEGPFPYTLVRDLAAALRAPVAATASTNSQIHHAAATNSGFP